MAAERPVQQQIIGEAPAFLEMLEHVSRAAPLSKPVLVVGERGTGKELIASRLHFLSERWEQPTSSRSTALHSPNPFSNPSCSGTKRARSLAHGRTHTSDISNAQTGGTLILDELATISLRMQEKILRVIEYGEIPARWRQRHAQRVDVRIVGSTNADLRALDGRGSSFARTFSIAWRST